MPIGPLKLLRKKDHNLCQNRSASYRIQAGLAALLEAPMKTAKNLVVIPSDIQHKNKAPRPKGRGIFGHGGVTSPIPPLEQGWPFAPGIAHGQMSAFIPAVRRGGRGIPRGLNKKGRESFPCPFILAYFAAPTMVPSTGNPASCHSFMPPG